MATPGETVNLYQNGTFAGVAIVTNVDADGNLDVCQLVSTNTEVLVDPTSPVQDSIYVLSAPPAEAAPETPAAPPAAQ
jgi:hypothetical protein